MNKLLDVCLNDKFRIDLDLGLSFRDTSGDPEHTFVLNFLLFINQNLQNIIL